VIGILDYGMGNLHSVKNAISYLGVKHIIISKNNEIDDCSHLIIPGVGAYSAAMSFIEERDYISDIKKFAASGRPLLGICLGMQLLSEFGHETIDCNGLGLIDGEVKHMDFNNVRIPHVGWNEIKVYKKHSILDNVKLTADFYFVHSYYFEPKSLDSIIATTNYGEEFAVIISNPKGNIIGIQFHPEKSQKQGLKILENFISLTPC
jgi:glutamine amidotransferase